MIVREISSKYINSGLKDESEENTQTIETHLIHIKYEIVINSENSIFFVLYEALGF